MKTSSSGRNGWQGGLASRFIMVMVIGMFLLSGAPCTVPGQRLPSTIDIAGDEQDMTIFGADYGDHLAGFNALAAGDFNGDGIMDIAIGVPFGDGPGNGRSLAGEAYVIFGSPSPPSVIDLSVTSADITIFGADPGDRLGFSLAGGDVNNDGIDDIIVSAVNADGPANGRSLAGEAYIIFGSSNPTATIDLSRTPADVTIFGADAGDCLGGSVASGDVNGDGIDDIIIGAEFADGPGNGRLDAGEAYVILGSSSLPSVVDLANGDQDLTIFAKDVGDRLNSLSSGDVNGDGIADIIIGAQRADGPGDEREDAGEVYIILGSTSLPPIIDLLSRAPDVTIFGADAGDRLGASLASGDINGDGVNDIIIGAVDASGPRNGRRNAGEAYVIFGSGANLPATMDIADGDRDMIIFGADAGDRLGASLASGDVNRDGIDDIVIGAESADGPENRRSNAGEIYVIYGGFRPPPTTDIAKGEQDATIFGADVDGKAGSSLASSDVNGDGVDDIIIGAELANGPDNKRVGAGEAYVILAPALPNAPPVADAGLDQVVTVGGVVELDGSGSSDPDGDPLSFSWRFIARPPGSAAALSDPHVVNPRFTADVEGEYILELTVNDGRGGSDTDQVRIKAITARKGDVDGDGKITILDARLVAEGAIGIRDLSPEQMEAGDVAPPIGELTIIDAQFIAEAAVDLRALGSDTGPGPGADTAAAVGSGRKTRARVKVEIEGKYIALRGTTTIQIVIRRAPTGLAGVQVGPREALRFDPKVIQVRSIKGIQPYQILASKIDNTRGEVKFALISVGGVGVGTRAGAIAELEVEASGVGESPISLSGFDVLADARGQRLDARAQIRIKNGRVKVRGMRAKEGGPIITGIRALPNPLRSSGSGSDSDSDGDRVVEFRVEGLGIEGIRVGIYDLSGRKVFDSGEVSGSTFRWHAVDELGRPLASGVYLYIMLVRGSSGEVLRSGLQKLVILG